MKNGTSILSITSLLILLGGVFFFVSKKNALNEINTIRERAENYSLVMLQDLGYGGLIHNVKNYLLRRDPEYYKQGKDNVANLKQLNTVIVGVSNPTILQNHADLMSMIDHYDKALDIIKNNVDLDTLTLDSYIAFDDIKTIEIVYDIQAANIIIKQTYTKASEELLFIMVAFIVTSVILFCISIISHLKESEVNRYIAQKEKLAASKVEKALSTENSLLKISNKILPKKFDTNITSPTLYSSYRIKGNDCDISLAKIAIFILLSNKKIQYFIEGDLLSMRRVINLKGDIKVLNQLLRKVGLNVDLSEVNVNENKGY
ncbi:hypothetical protein [Vibrio crassostreae]|uniref:hypothetical protein n=1 Tax=Vibrio crassostreae TaxID=246167 RepID=UPI001B30458E|nr:hypothetical protein [Vibrio crassostreae]